MADLEKDRIEAETLARLKADPELSQLASSIIAMPNTHAKVQLMHQYKTIAQQKGLLPQNYDPEFGGGALSVDHQNWWERNGKYVAAATAALPLLPIGAGAGAATGGAPAYSAPSAVAGSGAAGGGAAASGWLPALSAGSRIVGAAAQGREDARTNQANYAQNYDMEERARANTELSAAQTDIAQRRYLDDLYAAKTKQAIRGGLLQGVEDINIQRPAGIPGGNITGGLRPSAITNRQQIGDTIQRDALLELMNPTKVGGIGGDHDGSAGSGYLPSLPKLGPPSTPSQPGKLDTGLDLISLGLSIPDLLSQSRNAVQPYKPTQGVTFRNTQPVRLY